MRIDLIFDTICPWCFVGKRRLEQALAEFACDDVEINWLSFLLNPEMPAEGIAAETYHRAKYGNPVRSQRIYGAITEAGRSVGIDFDFERITRVPNSVDSHRLVKFAAECGRANETVEALYDAYFLKGLDTGSSAVLVRVATALGFDPAAIEDYLFSDRHTDTIREENARVHRMGVTGVPAYVIDGEFAVSGAQEPAIFLRLFDVARAQRVANLEVAPQTPE